jgi:hypothetical protein
VIQPLLLALNRFAPFRAGGRLLYHATGALAGQLCRALPQIQAMYLTGSMSTGDIAPGLSDIDIVLVIEDLPAGQEFRLIRRIESRLRYSLPPFGQDKGGDHLMIYSAEEWKTVGALLLGKRSGYPKVVFEKWTHIDYRTIGPQTQSLHHLLKALWRIESFDVRAARRSTTRLETLLQLRMADRLVGAMESAVQEVGLSLQTQPEFFELTASLRSDVGEMQGRSDDSGLAALLPRLLDCLDSAVRCCLPEPSQPQWAGPWRANGAAPDGLDAGPSRILARELLDTLGEVPDGQDVYVTRLKNTDVIVCDPLSPRTTQSLYDDYQEQSGRTLRIATPRIFQWLYLSAAFGPSKFVRLRDLKESVVGGDIGKQRFELEVYAMFPRVRALRKLENQAVFNSYAASLLQLLACHGNARQTPPAAGRAQPGPVSAEDRFFALRARSRELAGNMPLYPAGPGNSST